MGYIMNLRKYVGHDPLIGLGATTLVFNSKNELLLNLRSDTNTWGIPGGSMELYENIRDTAIRELKEEVHQEREIRREEKNYGKNISYGFLLAVSNMLNYIFVLSMYKFFVW